MNELQTIKQQALEQARKELIEEYPEHTHKINDYLDRKRDEICRELGVSSVEEGIEKVR